MHSAAFCSSTGPTSQHCAWPSLVGTLPGPGLAQSRCTCSCVPWSIRMSGSAGQVSPQLIRTAAHQCLAGIWEHIREILSPRSPHAVPAHMGVLSQPGTGLYKLHSVPLLWTSLNTEAWTLPSGFPKGGQERSLLPTHVSTPSPGEELDVHTLRGLRG